MAVLKCMHAYNISVEYHTGIQSAYVAERWTVDADERRDPWGALCTRYAKALGKDDADHRTWLQPDVVHVHSFESCHPDHGDDETLYALLVICERDDGRPFGVVCEQSSTYLMGDDGGTIDRL